MVRCRQGGMFSNLQLNIIASGRLCLEATTFASICPVSRSFPVYFFEALLSSNYYTLRWYKKARRYWSQRNYLTLAERRLWWSITLWSRHLLWITLQVHFRVNTFPMSLIGHQGIGKKSFIEHFGFPDFKEHGHVGAP